MKSMNIIYTSPLVTYDGVGSRHPTKNDALRKYDFSEKKVFIYPKMSDIVYHTAPFAP